MINKKQFQELSHTQQYDFLIKILSQVEPVNIMADLQQLFKVVNKPSKKMLLMVFEIIEGILDYAQNKDDTKKQEQLSVIQNKLRTLRHKEHEERQDIQYELEKLLDQLDC